MKCFFIQLIFDALKIMPVTCANIEPFHFSQHKYVRSEIHLPRATFYVFSILILSIPNLETIFKDQMYAWID
jgi:hypothetical protein